MTAHAKLEWRMTPPTADWLPWPDISCPNTAFLTCSSTDPVAELPDEAMVERLWNTLSAPDRRVMVSTVDRIAAPGLLGWFTGDGPRALFRFDAVTEIGAFARVFDDTRYAILLFDRDAPEPDFADIAHWQGEAEPGPGSPFAPGQRLALRSSANLTGLGVFAGTMEDMNSFREALVL